MKNDHPPSSVTRLKRVIIEEVEWGDLNSVNRLDIAVKSALGELERIQGLPLYHELPLQKESKSRHKDWLFWVAFLVWLASTLAGIFK